MFTNNPRTKTMELRWIFICIFLLINLKSHGIHAYSSELGYDYADELQYVVDEAKRGGMVRRQGYDEYYPGGDSALTPDFGPDYGGFASGPDYGMPYGAAYEDAPAVPADYLRHFGEPGGLPLGLRAASDGAPPVAAPAPAAANPVDAGPQPGGSPYGGGFNFQAGPNGDGGLNVGGGFDVGGNKVFESSVQAGPNGVNGGLNIGDTSISGGVNSDGKGTITGGVGLEGGPTVGGNLGLGQNGIHGGANVDFGKWGEEFAKLPGYFEKIKESLGNAINNGAGSVDKYFEDLDNQMGSKWGTIKDKYNNFKNGIGDSFKGLFRGGPSVGGSLYEGGPSFALGGTRYNPGNWGGQDGFDQDPPFAAGAKRGGGDDDKAPAPSPDHPPLGDLSRKELEKLTEQLIKFVSENAAPPPPKRRIYQYRRLTLPTRRIDHAPGGVRSFNHAPEGIRSFNHAPMSAPTRRINLIPASVLSLNHAPMNPLPSRRSHSENHAPMGDSTEISPDDALRHSKGIIDDRVLDAILKEIKSGMSPRRLLGSELLGDGMEGRRTNPLKHYLHQKQLGIGITGPGLGKPLRGHKYRPKGERVESLKGLINKSGKGDGGSDKRLLV